MKVTYAPNNYQPSGVVSFASWSNTELHKAIRAMFNESPREEIVEIVVERDGIKAIFQTRAGVKVG